MSHIGKRGLAAIPRPIWALGLVSLCMDLSSELVHSLLPVFLVTTLGASVLTIGFIEGVAEATAAIGKVFSGVLSDYWGRRKPLVVLGYGLAALTKPLFPLASSATWVFAARFIDRVGKGIRGAPRDALIGDITPPQLRGAAYGLRQALDTVGAFLGPLAAVALMLLFAGDIRAVLWFAVIPAALAVLVLVVGVPEPETAHPGHASRKPISRHDFGQLSRAYWEVVAIGAVLTLARFSEAFLVLKAQSTGLAATWIPLVMVVMSVVYSATSYPAGVLADRVDRRTILSAGLAALIAADLVLALAGNIAWVMAGVTLWGLHMGLTQGLLAALVADTAPARLRGTAFGVFNLVSGVALLAASVIAGWLWARFGAATTFYAGAAFTALALAGFAWRRAT